MAPDGIAYALMQFGCRGRLREDRLADSSRGQSPVRCFFHKKDDFTHELTRNVTSSRIEEGLFLLYTLAEKGIGQTGRRNDVHGFGEEPFQLLPQCEVGRGVLRRRAVPQIGEEIEVARRQRGAIRCRPEGPM